MELTCQGYHRLAWETTFFREAESRTAAGRIFITTTSRQQFAGDGYRDERHDGLNRKERKERRG